MLRLKDRIPVALEKISKLIDDIPLLSDIRKAFYKESIEYRYKYGLSRAFEGLSGHGGYNPEHGTKEKKEVTNKEKKKDKGGYYR